MYQLYLVINNNKKNNQEKEIKRYVLQLKEKLINIKIVQILKL